MKTLFAYVLLGCAATLATAADVPTLKADHKPDAAAQLMKVERDLNEAFKARDKNALMALCSEDFVFTDDDGKISGKTQFLRDATSNIQVVSYKLSDLVVHVYGDTGIITGKWSGTIKTEDAESKTALRFTDTFVRRDERWWEVASQLTRLAQNDAQNE